MPRKIITSGLKVSSPYLCAALLSVGLGCGNGVAPDTESLPEAQNESALNNGTYDTTLFPEVLQIQIIVKKTTNWLGMSNTTWQNCSATAIADDLLLTASHCVKKEGTDVADYVKILTANGDNSSADGAYSSYIIMSEDIYNNIHSVDEESQYYYRDFAIIKFGKGTFSKYYDFTYKTDKVSTGDTLTVVGFGDQTTKAYGTTTISSTSTVTSTSDYGYFKTQSNSTVFGQGVTEDGDSGGPLLYKENGKYYLVGVLYGNSSSGSVTTSTYPAITPAVYNHISTFLTSRSKYCVEAAKDINYTGDPLSFCIHNSITSDLEGQGFYDPWNMYQKWNFDDWNDKISSVRIPSNMSITFFQNTSGGGDSVTFVNAFPFLSNGNISSMVDYSFNDKVSSFSQLYSSSPTVSIQNKDTGKCLDVSGGSTVNGANIQQWECQSGNNNQVWTLVSTSTSNVYQLKNSTSGKCMNLQSGNTANGTQIQQHDCNSSNTDNLFKFEAHGTLGRFHIIHNASGKCIDLDGGGTDNGEKIQLWDCLSTSNSVVGHQQFVFKRYY